MNIDTKITAANLANAIDRCFAVAASKIKSLDKRWGDSAGAPVFTIDGKYTVRGWTEWTQGFQYGSALLAFDGTGDESLLTLGRRRTLERMLPHVTHTGVHDHGFNNLSTYGNLLRLIDEGKTRDENGDRAVCINAIKCSGAVQAARWSGVRVDQLSQLSATSSQLGYVYSFNGPHSLFVDTMRTIRIMGVAWKLGHVLMHENDRAADLLKRSVMHGLATNQYVVFHGHSDHAYDVRGRTCHEAIFNRNDGVFRSRSTQQGYSPFSTWTRGLAWAMLGFAEELEFFETIKPADFKKSVGLEKSAVVKVYEQAAVDTCDHYINDCSTADGLTYWDDGAPGLAKLGDWRSKPADPFNDFEPVDSSASAIAAQGLLRLGKYLGKRGAKYAQAGLNVTRTLLGDPYLSASPNHEGLLLHSIYHRPNNWDHTPAGRKIPCGESSLWGDYHLLELCVYLKRLIGGGKYYTFFS